MVCYCAECKRLAKRTLQQLPFHYGRAALVQQLCECVLFRAVQLSPQTIQKPPAALQSMGESVSFIRKPTTATVIRFRFDDQPAQYDMTDEYLTCKGSEFYATLWTFARDAGIDCISRESYPPQMEFSWPATETVSVWRNVLRIAHQWYANELPLSTLCDRHDRSFKKLAKLNEEKKQSEEHKLMRMIIETCNAPDSPIGWLNIDIDGPVLWYLYDVEWHVLSNQTHRGVGDLVFANRLGMFAVVEVKYLNLKITGPTARAKRTHKRKLLRAQTQKYGNAIRSKHPNALMVLPTFYTNEEPRVALADDMDTDERRLRVSALVAAAKTKSALERTERKRAPSQRKSTDDDKLTDHKSSPSLQTKRRVDDGGPGLGSAVIGLAVVAACAIAAGGATNTSSPRDVPDKKKQSSSSPDCILM